MTEFKPGDRVRVVDACYAPGISSGDILTVRACRKRRWEEPRSFDVLVEGQKNYWALLIEPAPPAAEPMPEDRLYETGCCLCGASECIPGMPFDANIGAIVTRVNKGARICYSCREPHSCDIDYGGWSWADAEITRRKKLLAKDSTGSAKCVKCGLRPVAVGCRCVECNANHQPSEPARPTPKAHGVEVNCDVCGARVPASAVSKGFCVACAPAGIGKHEPDPYASHKEPEVDHVYVTDCGRKRDRAVALSTSSHPLDRLAAERMRGKIRALTLDMDRESPRTFTDRMGVERTWDGRRVK